VAATNIKKQGNALSALQLKPPESSSSTATSNGFFSLCASNIFLCLSTNYLFLIKKS
jgi:hypothetical protein